ncbi:MFS-type transporter involved in bile tolerance, Atg22 family [Bacillus sp. 491mf]|uniref:MFS transporter n=1 Tax=Bacillus sp. 491mf TaxID=1761755 RepID=UPI0008EBEAC9|nr:MFS transporter [Bacillus sp. 491mf]SFC76675.1 MFS-type transporter involved in bile tolerance, Atg22 family [Bacillus sp. 491mf]
MNPAVTPFKRLVTALMISNTGIYIALIPPMALLITLKLQAIAPQNVAGAMATVLSIGAIVAMIANPVAGAISDRTRLKFGRRRTWILIGSILGGASVLGIGFSNQVWQVVLTWSCAQMFFNFVLSANNALVADQVEVTRRGSISGILGSITSVAAIIGITLANALGQSQVLKWVVLAIIPVVFAIIAVSLIRDSGSTVSRESKKEKFSFSKIIPSPRKYPAFAYTWLARFLVLFVGATGSFGTLFLSQRFHFSAAELGGKVALLTAIGTIITFLFSIIGGFLSDYLKRQKPFVIGAGILIGLALILQGFTSNFTIYLILAVISAIGSGIFYAVDMALLTRVLPNPEDAAKDLGILNIANALPQTIVPAIMPFLLGLGGYELAFSVIGILSILGAIAVLKVPEMSSEKKGSSDLNDQTLEFI